MSDTKIPIALVEANENTVRVIQKLLLPEFDTVHVCLTTEAMMAELVPIIMQQQIGIQAPACNLGTNALVPLAARRLPRAVVTCDFENGHLASTCLDRRPEVPVIQADVEGLSDNPEGAADKIRKLLEEAVANGSLKAE